METPQTLTQADEAPTPLDPQTLESSGDSGPPDQSPDLAVENPVAIDDHEAHGKDDGSDYKPIEFLDRLRDAALDSVTANEGEITNLRSWVKTFIPGKGSLMDDSTKDGLIQKKKKRRSSMAELVAGTDLDDVEGIGSTQRERKKSKYLSPPYLNSGSKLSALMKDSSPGSRALVLRSPDKEEDKMMSALNVYDNVDVSVILSDLLSTAVNPFHLKGNRSGNTIRGFIGEFRSSVFQSVELDSLVGEFADVEMSDGIKEGERKRKRIRKKGEADAEAPLNSSKVKEGKARQRMKVLKNGANGESSLNLSPGVANGSKDESKIVASGETMLDSGNHDPFLFIEGGALQKKKKKKKSKVAAIEGTPLGSRGQKKMKKSNSELNGHRKASDFKIMNGAKRGTSQQKRKIEEALSGSPAALILTFTPGTTLPSRDELISKFSSYGDLMEPKAEFLRDSCSASIVFARSADAEKAFNSPDKKTAFGAPLASCRLRYLPEKMSGPSLTRAVKKSPLPYIRKSLMRMITSLTRAPDGLKMEEMEDLVGDMKAVLERVDRLLTRLPSAASP